MSKYLRAAVAGAFLVGVAVTATPASAICTWSPDPVFGTCNPCQLAGVAYGPADEATGGKVLPPLVCVA